MSTVTPEAPSDGAPAEAPQRHPLASWFYRHPRTRLSLLLLLPLGWLLVVYLGSLAMLFVTAFWQVDSFTGQIERVFTFDNFVEIATDPAYYQVALRTIGIAAAVTVLAALIGLPMAFYMARVARPSHRALLVALVLTPLWASYLVKVYSWRTMFQPETGVIAWLLNPFGLDSPGYGALATITTLTYLWLPYMILPLYAGLERIPDSLLDASADLGAHTGRTFRSVVMPILWPSLVAGSIFTFSLSLGDYITVQIVGGKLQMLGNVVYQNFTLNLPFAAAVATIPVLVMVVYLWAVRRTGALDNL
jgi:putative spermidine/putrescine transport system permease protein